MYRTRVVVTGLGAVSPLGTDLPSTWQGLVDGRCGVRAITRFDTTGLPTRIAATVEGFDPARAMNARDARRTAAFVQYAVAAAREAVSHAGLDLAREDATRVGVEIGSALGGSSVIEEQRVVLEARGPGHVNPILIPVVLLNAAACMVSIQLGIKGPVYCPVSACATGVVAIGSAAQRIAWGEADVVLAGGSDSMMTALAVTAFSRLGAASTRNDTPERACSPFSAGRDGAVVGEGATVLVLETLEHAQRRGAPILAEVLGYGVSADAYHVVAPEPGGEGAARAMRAALRSAGAGPEALDWICAHGTGTPLNDAAETCAIKAALGEAAYRVPVSSIKGAVGHMLGAAGAISAAAAVLALGTGIIPPTINYAGRDPECDLDYVPNTARRAPLRTAMVNGFGFGGQNASLVLRGPD